MIVQCVLINQETGEPIYDAVLLAEVVLEAKDNAALRNHADLALEALKKYKPRTPALHKIGKDQQLPDDPFSSSGGDDLNGPVDYF